MQNVSANSSARQEIVLRRTCASRTWLSLSLAIVGARVGDITRWPWTSSNLEREFKALRSSKAHSSTSPTRGQVVDQIVYRPTHPEGRTNRVNQLNPRHVNAPMIALESIFPRDSSALTEGLTESLTDGGERDKFSSSI